MSPGPGAGPLMLAERIRQRIAREGPVSYDQFVELALYDPRAGFYARGGGAGRGGRDFVTSPETGSLFGLMVARAIDGWWHSLGKPDPFLVVEVGAGRGTLAREVLRADPGCAPALRYVLVEISEQFREDQRALLALDDPAVAFGPGVVDEFDPDAVVTAPETGPIVVGLDAFPAVAFTGVVLANELLDNLPFAVVEARDGAWSEVRIGGGPEESFVEILVPLGARASEPAFSVLPDAGKVAEGTRLPVATGLRTFVADVAAHLRKGFLACFDYAEPLDVLVERNGGWLRTYRSHERRGSPLEDPGTRDITIDVPVEAFDAAVAAYGMEFLGAERQADWLGTLGIEALADQAAQTWREHAATGDLSAWAARSRVHEAAALTDPGGLGAFRLLLARRA